MSGGRRRDPQAGFTLLETLVALAILGIVMSTVYAVIAAGLRSAHRDEDRLLLGLVAQNLLARSSLDLDPLRGPLTGDIEGGLHWRIESAPYPVPADILPEPPPQDRTQSRGTGSASTGGGDETATPRSSQTGGLEPQTGAAQAGPGAGTGAAAGAANAGEGEPGRPGAAGAPKRPQLGLRLIRVTVDKGGQSFALDTLAVDRLAEAGRAP